MITMMERVHPSLSDTATTADDDDGGVGAADYYFSIMGGDGDGDDGDDAFLLPPSFVPGRWDVICQRGKECFEHGASFFVSLVAPAVLIITT